MVGALVGEVIADTGAMIYDVDVTGSVRVTYNNDDTDINFDGLSVGGVIGRFLSESPAGAYDKVTRVHSTVTTSIGLLGLTAATNYMTVSLGGLVGYAKNVGLHENTVNGAAVVFILDPLEVPYNQFLSSSRVDVGGLVGWADHDNADYGYDGPALLYMNQVGTHSSVLIKGLFNVGGLAGAVSSMPITKISENTVQNTIVSGERDVGGLVGDSMKAHYHNNLSHHVTLRAENYYTDYTNSNFGGLIGSADQALEVFNNTVSDLVTTNLLESGTGEVGGLIGSLSNYGVLNDNTVKNSSIISSAYVGGLLGYGNGPLINRAKVVNTTIEAGSAVGGLIGYTYGQVIINDSFTDTTLMGSSMVGGLIGAAMDDQVFINRSFTLGVLEGNQDLGGFIGMANSQNFIDNCFSRMTMRYDNSPVPVILNGIGESIVGGIIGYDLGDPASTYNRLYFAGTFVPISGISPYVDPIIGYTTAALPASVTPAITVGNLVYDITLYPGPLSTGLAQGLTTAQLMEELGYTGFDFEGIWRIDPYTNDGYAILDEGYILILFINEPNSFGYPDFAGSKVIKPADPTKSGFIFGGWYLEDTFTTAWDFDTGIAEDDVTLYAKWTAQLPNTGEPLASTWWIGSLALGLWLISRKRKSH
jgi:uncharacterized repeat protein (TIGR02543 family)